ncbi:MAG: ATP-grasp domain-containing protein [Candidatus Pacebacteria bacterium]|nr:ATP-grasp domain-containing protein [Candidatus Paceibacterota bacterium]
MKSNTYIINPTPAFKKFPQFFNGASCQSIQSHQCVIIAKQGDVRMFHKGQQLDFQNSMIFIRGRGEKTKDTFFLSILTEFFYQNKIPTSGIVNRYHTYASEKLTQMIKFGIHNIPIPKSIIIKPEAIQKNKQLILQEMSFPCVLKSRGANGRTVWKIDSFHELREKIKFITEEVVLLQEYIENAFDIRTLVFGKNIIGSMKRSSDGFLNNISQGGKGSPIKITKKESIIAIKANTIAETGFGGVDIIRSKRGPVIIEVNRKPGITGKFGFIKTTGINVPEKIAEIIAKKKF